MAKRVPSSMLTYVVLPLLFAWLVVRGETTDRVVSGRTAGEIMEDVNSGRTVFYEFYTAQEKKEQRAKSNTGLFLFYLQGAVGRNSGVIGLNRTDGPGMPRNERRLPPTL